MKTLRTFITENEEAHDPHKVVFAFGRFNPPHIGHGAVIDKVHELAQKHNASHVVVASHSQDAKKNPLPLDKKLHYLNHMFPDTDFGSGSKEKPTFIHHLKHLSDNGYKHVIMVTGSDRAKEYKDKIDSYNGKEYHFDKVEVHSAGAERNDNNSGVSGMSASKMRKHAADGNLKEFAKGVPAHVPHKVVKSMYNDVRHGLNIDK